MLLEAGGRHHHGRHVLAHRPDQIAGGHDLDQGSSVPGAELAADQLQQDLRQVPTVGSPRHAEFLPAHEDVVDHYRFENRGQVHYGQTVVSCIQRSSQGSLIQGQNCSQAWIPYGPGIEKRLLPHFRGRFSRCGPRLGIHRLNTGRIHGLTRGLTHELIDRGLGRRGLGD